MPSSATGTEYSITGLDIATEQFTNVAINNQGSIALASGFDEHNEPNKVFLLDHGQVTPLNTLGGHGTFIADVNNEGLLAGSSETLTGPGHAVLYENGVLQDMGTVVPDGVSISAINDAGISVGNTLDSKGNRAVIVTGANQFTILGTLGGHYSSASDINNLVKLRGEIKVK